MIATETTRKQTGWRVNPILIERVKEAAKRKSISANDYVESILFDATKDIESEKERNERIAKNEAFLNRFAGKWSGDESPNEILEEDIPEISQKEIILLSATHE